MQIHQLFFNDSYADQHVEARLNRLTHAGNSDIWLGQYLVYPGLHKGKPTSIARIIP